MNSYSQKKGNVTYKEFLKNKMSLDSAEYVLPYLSRGNISHITRVTQNDDLEARGKVGSNHFVLTCTCMTLLLKY